VRGLFSALMRSGLIGTEPANDSRWCHWPWRPHARSQWGLDVHGDS